MRVAALLLLFVAGCDGSQPLAPDVAARIGSRDVYYVDFERHVRASVGEDAAGLGSQVLSRLLDRYLEEETLVDLARARGLQGGRREVVEALLATEGSAGPDDAEVRDYFEAHRTELSRPARVWLRQILVEDREIALRAAEEVHSGAPFEQVARRVSQDPTAELGGDQGILPVEDLPPVFAEAVAGLEAGEISAVVEADYGFHIFQLVERLPEEPLELAEAELAIRERLLREGNDTAYARLVREARDRYDVQLYVQNLPFDYQPAPTR